MPVFPSELTSERRWVVARLEPRDGRLTKVPYCALNPSQPASSTNPSTWSDFKTASRRASNGLLLGFMLGDGFVGIDLDKCLHEGVVEPWAADIVNLLDSYTEPSVSGTGIHVICRGTLPPGGRRKDAVEMYDRARFFVMTGSGTGTLVDRTPQLAILHAQIFGPPVSSSKPIESGGFDTHSDDRRGKEGITDDDVFHPLSDDDVLMHAATAANGEKFLKLWRGDLSDHGNDHSSADLALVSILMYWCGNNREQADRLFRLSDLVRPKWTDRADYRERTFNKAT